MYLASTRRGLGDSSGSGNSGGATLETSLIQAGISIASALLIGPITHLIQGCGATCVQSTNYANAANALLEQNIAAYFARPTPRPMSVQAAFLANFDTIWNHLQQQCATVSGTAGQKCISDRQAGSCAYTQPASSVPPWGVPPAGACWNWFAGFRDPIANDPNVYDDSASAAVSNAAAAVSSAVSGGSSVSGLSVGTLAALAAAAVVIWAVAS
jgi:hypothetical protein